MTESNLESERLCACKHKGCSKLGEKCCYRNVDFLQTFNSAWCHCFLFSCLVGTDDDDCFYIALFSILKHSLRWHVILHEWLAFYSTFFFFNSHQSDVLYSSGIAGSTWNCCHLGASLCTPYNHAPCHFMQRYICKVHAWMLKAHWTQYKLVFHKLNCWSMTGSLLCKHGICLTVLQFLL